MLTNNCLFIFRPHECVMFISQLQTRRKKKCEIENKWTIESVAFISIATRDFQNCLVKTVWQNWIQLLKVAQTKQTNLSALFHFFIFFFLTCHSLLISFVYHSLHFISLLFLSFYIPNLMRLQFEKRHDKNDVKIYNTRNGNCNNRTNKNMTR